MACAGTTYSEMIVVVAVPLFGSSPARLTKTNTLSPA